MADTAVKRSAIQARCPTRTSTTPSGVASMAKYVRIHLMAPMNGYMASLPPICMAVAAINPGARKSMYFTPSTVWA